MIGYFIVLSAVWQNVFYVHRPPFVEEVFGVFDSNGSRKNDTWPDNWHRLIKSTLNHTSVFQINLTNIVNNSTRAVDYKLKLVFHDRSYTTTPWKVLFMDDDVKLADNAVSENNTIPIIFFAIFCVIQTITIVTWYIYCKYYKKGCVR